MTVLESALVSLDRFLTKSSEHDATLRYLQGFTFEFGSGDVYYLSDGGYSQVGFTEKGKVFLTSNSTEGVKQAWFGCPDLRANVEREFRDAYQRWIDRGCI